jgi:hypothetical protein
VTANTIARTLLAATAVMISSTSWRARGLAGASALLLGLALLGGCKSRDSSANNNMSQHRVDGDTGAAAPATVIDMSATPRPGDSTPAVANPTGRADAASSDTMGTRAKDRTPGARGGKPVGRP